VHRTDASGSWTVEDIAPFADPDGYGNPDIAIDNQGSLAIAYDRLVDWGEMGYYASGTFVTTNSGADWSDPVLVEAESNFPSVAMRDGTVHVAYGTSLGGAFDIDCDPVFTLPVGYATVRAGSVSNQTVAPMGEPPKLALAADGTPRVVFGSLCAGEVLFADGSSGTFDDQPIPLGADDTPVDVAIGSDGTVHVLFYRTGDSTTSVGYVALTNDGWTTPELISDGDLGALAVDGRGGIHVVVFSGGALVYATRTDARFVIAPEPLAQVGPDSFQDLAIAVDADGRPHVAYSADDPKSGVFYLVGPAYAND
jgi:hypothetical protein